MIKWCADVLNDIYYITLLSDNLLAETHALTQPHVERNMRPWVICACTESVIIKIDENEEEKKTIIYRPLYKF